MKPICLAAGVFAVVGAAIAADPVVPLKRSDEISLVMRDGTFFKGKLDVKTFEVETLYGKLTVPASDVIRIRIGKKADKDLKARIEKLIADLANKDFRIREEAQKELSKLGKAAYSEIEAASRSTDTEVKERATALLANITLDDGDEPQLNDDEVLTPNFAIRGTVKLDALAVATKFGILKVEKKDLLSMTLAEPEFAAKIIAVNGKTTTQGQWFDTGIRVRKGDRLIVNANGSINWVNYGNTTEPQGNENWGTWRNLGMQQVFIGALVGKIGNGGAIFLVGEKYNDKVAAEGTLYLAIAANWGGNMQSNGEYKVKAEVRPAAETPVPDAK